jgi:hypothetical protein
VPETSPAAAAPAPGVAAPAASPTPSPRPLRAAAAWAIAAAVTALFFAPALSPARQFGYFDNGRMNVPMKRYIAEELSAGRFPAWNPYAGLGTPIAAGGVDAVQHPFNLLLVALPFDLGFKLWVLLCFPIAAMGAWAWASRLGAGRGAALAAGLAFALSGYAVSMTGNMVYLGALAFFPWILWAGGAFTERPRPATAAWTAIASGLCVANGDPQGWALAVGLLPLAAVALPPAGVSRRRAVARAAGAVTAAIVGALPFLVPVLAWIPHSGRAEAFDAYEYEHFNLLPARALELAIPHLFRTDGRHLASALYEACNGNRLTPFPWALSEYLGVTTVALAALAAVRRRQARWLLAGAAVFGWMAMGPNAGFGQLARHLPILSSLRYWEKLAAWPALLVAVAAAFGVDALLERPADARRLGTSLLTIGAALVAGGAAAAAAPDSAAALLAPAGAADGVGAAMAANVRDGLLHAGALSAALALVARAVAAGRLRRPVLAIAAVVVLDVAAGNARAYVLSDVASTRPPSPMATYLRAQPGLQRVMTPFGLYPDGDRYAMEMEPAWRLSAETLYAAWNVPERIGNYQIYSGMLPVRSNRYWRRAGRPDRLPDVGTWAMAWLYLPPELSAGSRRFIPPGAVPVDAPGVPGQLLRLPARPRTYVAQALSSVDRRAAMEFVLDPASAPSDRSVVEAPVPAGYAPPAGDARITAEASDDLTVSARADRPALVVLNDIYTVGWTAEVDGAPAEILPVNYLARGVWIGPGEHAVRFRYRTPWLRESWALLGAAALGLLLWHVRAARREDAAA